MQQVVVTVVVAVPVAVVVHVGTHFGRTVRVSDAEICWLHRVFLGVVFGAGDPATATMPQLISAAPLAVFEFSL